MKWSPDDSWDRSDTALVISDSEGLVIYANERARASFGATTGSAVADLKPTGRTTANVISTLSHELRSPLTSVRGYVRTLLRRWDAFEDDLKIEMLEAVVTDAERVGRMIDELLDLSRLESGKLQLNRVPTDLAQIAERVCSRLESTPDHTITCDTQPVELNIDSDKVEQIITNLVTNAIRHTPGGEIRVTVEPPGVLEVTDSGPGMNPADIPGIFDPYVRRSKSPEGTGLGLHLAQQFVEAHGGTVTVQSSPDSGSTFTVTFPEDH